MAKKKFFLIVDSETTQTDMIADLGVVVADKQGNVHYEGGFMVADFFCNPEAHPLFHQFGDKNDVFSKASLPARRAAYEAMLKDGRRMLASVNAINVLLGKINAKYSPVLTAYNLAFDSGKASNSGINLDQFEQSFCLWHAAAAKWGQTKAFREFVLANHYFGARTKPGNMTIQTKADVMAKFLLGASLPNEPHTALEDARDYELPILKALVANTSPKDYMNPPGYNWRNFMVKNAFKAI